MLVLVAAIGDKVNVLVASKTKDDACRKSCQRIGPIVDGRGGGKTRHGHGRRKQPSENPRIVG